MNVLVEGFLVDAYWPQARLVVELQSWEHHGHRRAFERDSSKLTRLQIAGYTALPMTDRQLRYGRESVIAGLAALLRGPGLTAPAAGSATAGASL